MPKKQGKGAKQSSSQRPSGTATPAEPVAAPAEPPKPSRPTVVGINFGYTCSSVAVLEREKPEVIANDDGERQIPNALAFDDDQEYIGAPARQQLVRNSANVILGSRHLVGKSYADVDAHVPPHSAAPLVDAAGRPGYAVQTHGHARTFTADEVAAKLFTSLLTSASEFLGRRVDAVALAVPSTAPAAEHEALRQVARSAGVEILQLVPCPAAVLSAYGRLDVAAAQRLDTTALVLDVGASTTDATVVGIRNGLIVTLGHAHQAALGGEAIDDAFIHFLAKEFTKKTKTPLDLSANARAAMKLRLAAEITKRSLSASASAPVSVESLADGIDFSTTVNRTRLDMLCSRVYADIVRVVEASLADANIEPVEVDEVFLAGGSTKLPSLVDRVALVFPEGTPMHTSIDPDEVIARGAAIQAALLVPQTALSVPAEAASTAVSTPSLAHPIGLKAADGSFTVLLDAATPLPARRLFEAPTTRASGAALLSLYEGRRQVESVQPPAKAANGAANGDAGSEDDEDDEDDEPTKRVVVSAQNRLAELSVPFTGKSLVATLVVDADGRGTLRSATGEHVAFGA